MLTRCAADPAVQVGENVAARINIAGAVIEVQGPAHDTLDETEDAAISAAVLAIFGPDTTWRRRTPQFPARPGEIPILLGTEAIGALCYSVVRIDERFYDMMW